MTTNTTPELAPHQLRVIAERESRATEMSRLSEFIRRNPTFGSLHLKEQERLRRQEAIMGELVRVLDERIAAFTEPDPETHPMSVLIGNRVIRLRNKLGITQAELACRVRCDRGILIELENGTRTSIKFDTLVALAASLKTTVTALMSDSQD